MCFPVILISQIHPDSGYSGYSTGGEKSGGKSPEAAGWSVSIR